MKFCPECGTPLNGATECDVCGYNKENTENNIEKNYVDNQNLLTNNFIGMKIVNEPKIDHIVELEELKNIKIELGDLLSISFDSSGGMTGGYSYIRIDFKTKILEAATQYNHFDPIEIKKYTILDEELKKIEDLIKQYNFPAWSRVDVDRTYIAYDAPTRSFNLTYSNGTYRIPYLIYMNKEESEIFYNFGEVVCSLRKEENLVLKKVINNTNGYPMMGIMNPNPDEKTIYYCTKCDKKLEKNKFECECGYIVKEEYRN